MQLLERETKPLIEQLSPFADQIPTLRTCDGSYLDRIWVERSFLSQLCRAKRIGRSNGISPFSRFLDDGIQRHPFTVRSSSPSSDVEGHLSLPVPNNHKDLLTLSAETGSKLEFYGTHAIPK